MVRCSVVEVTKSQGMKCTPFERRDKSEVFVVVRCEEVRELYVEGRMLMVKDVVMGSSDGWARIAVASAVPSSPAPRIRMRLTIADDISLCLFCCLRLESRLVTV